MPFVDYRKNSRTNWGSQSGTDDLKDRKDIEFGCLLRIADATEAMAQNFTRLQNQNSYLERRVKELSDALQIVRRQRASLRGVITRMKKAR